MRIIENLASSLQLKKHQVETIISLLDEGNTVPFLARYRKDETGNVDDETLRKFETELLRLRQIESRRDEILRLLEEQGQLTSQLKQVILAASQVTQLEDIYRPFRPKRETRASKARDNGLLPLAKMIEDESQSVKAIEQAAKRFINEVYVDEQAVLQGAKDIIAEALADSPETRQRLRQIWLKDALLTVKRKGEGNPIYQTYEDFSHAWSAIKSYQILAINRGEKEGFLQVKTDLAEDYMVRVLLGFFRYPQAKEDFLAEICLDTWKRLLKPSLENELRGELKSMAETEAMETFAKNLRATLLDQPLPGQTVMALDPGFRNGCKVGIVDKQANYLDSFVIYPIGSEQNIADAKIRLAKAITQYAVDVVAIGNGTATRETEDFFQSFLAESGIKMDYLIVNEAGASVYSASEIAREELGFLDVNLRSAVSLARRVLDPLAELVKVEAKALGVGQYQHDMNQKQLELRLSSVVEDCVNQVGADLNLASEFLLQHIAGISPQVAKNIVAYREANKAFKQRKDLLKVPRLGPKAYEQAAGFLYIRDGKEALDSTFIHPESYTNVYNLLKYFKLDLESAQVGALREKIGDEYKAVAKQFDLGTETLKDIVDSLEKRGLDPRDIKIIPKRMKHVQDIKDLKPGMRLPGVVRNVTQFGAFVDIGVHQDGLVHISEIKEGFVKNPHDYFHAGQNLEVDVIEIDLERKRIALSTKGIKLN